MTSNPKHCPSTFPFNFFYPIAPTVCHMIYLTILLIILSQKLSLGQHLVRLSFNFPFSRTLTVPRSSILYYLQASLGYIIPTKYFLYENIAFLSCGFSHIPSPQAHTLLYCFIWTFIQFSSVYGSFKTTLLELL